MSNVKTTPMLEQYLGIKKEHPDALLFYRMGDFYELFFEDAETAARDLRIALTSRNPNAEVPVPMCGVPYHSAGNYLKKLLDKGHKVAVCDQVEDPKKARGLVRRAVTRVLTPGTVIEDENLAAKDHNFLAALYFSREAGAGGLAWVDFSTGQWTGLFSHKEDTLWQWVGKIGPSELLLSQGQEIPNYFQDDAVQINRVPSPAYFSLSGAGREIQKAQGVASLNALDLDDKPELVMACGALLSYLRHTQKQDLTHLGAFQPMNLSSRLLLDEVTERNLEIFRRLDGKTGKGTLIHVLDHTKTPMGGRLLADRLRRPWKDLGIIRKTQDAVQYFLERDKALKALREALDQVYDLERLSTRISLNRAAPRDFLALRQSLLILPRIESIFKELDDAHPKTLQETLEVWDNFEDYSGLLARALADDPPPVITEGGLFKRGYDLKLDELLDLTEHGEAKLKSLLVEEQNSGNLEKLKLGYNKVFGYYFELPQSQSARAPYHFIRRQTLVNSERFVTPKLKELEERL
ncbi:MAG: DNA mismatch repair protein MutS, partial [Thermodesulfobacteriota bacterium]|nr:DNA mismatch repair protein MutS [Thermodesulfobacteriota bacterium]